MAKAKEETETGAAGREFLQWLETFCGGEAVVSLATEFQKLTKVCRDEAVNQNKKTKGTLTFTIKIEAEPDDAIVKTSYATKKSEPARNTGSSIYFVDKHGKLSREAPKQMKLPMRVINTEGEARDVGVQEEQAQEV